MRTLVSSWISIILIATTAHADTWGELDPKKVGPERIPAMQKGFLAGQATLSKDERLVQPLREAVEALNAALEKTGDCWPNRRLALTNVVAAARHAFKVPIAEGIQPVLEAFKTAGPGKEAHPALVEALETAKKSLTNAGGAFANHLERAIEFLRDKDCDLWFKKGAAAPEAPPPAPAAEEELPQLDPKKVAVWTHQVVRQGFVEGQTSLSRDASLVQPLLEAIAALKAARGKTGECWANRWIALSQVVAAARHAFKVPLTEGLRPVLEAFKAAAPGKDAHAALVEALEGAKKALGNAGGAFASYLGNAIEYLRDKDCELPRKSP
jgi:hypothetical protein